MPSDHATGPVDDVRLRRELTTTTLTLNGVGVMVGAGIFVLVGKVVGEAGNAAWLAFVAAAVVALPTALAYAELASRYPRSSGEAVFTERAFGRPSLSFVVGFLVVASGLMSTAAVSVGFAEYLEVVTGPVLTDAIVITAFLGVLSIVNARGIRESTWLNVGLTVVSVLALVTLSWFGLSSSPGPVVPTPDSLDLVADDPARRIGAGLLRVHRLRRHLQRRRGDAQPVADRPAGDPRLAGHHDGDLRPRRPHRDRGRATRPAGSSRRAAVSVVLADLPGECRSDGSRS